MFLSSQCRANPDKLIRTDSQWAHKTAMLLHPMLDRQNAQEKVCIRSCGRQNSSMAESMLLQQLQVLARMPGKPVSHQHMQARTNRVQAGSANLTYKINSTIRSQVNRWTGVL